MRLLEGFGSCSLTDVCITFAAFTFLCQVLIHDQFAVPKVIQDGAEVRGVSIDKVGSRLVLEQNNNVRVSFGGSCAYFLVIPGYSGLSISFLRL